MDPEKRRHLDRVIAESKLGEQRLRMQRDRNVGPTATPELIEALIDDVDRAGARTLKLQLYAAEVDAKPAE